MKERILCINNRDFERAYALIEHKNENTVHLSAFDFLFECVAENAYDFLRFCINRNPDKIFRIALCHLLAYGDVVIVNYHSIIYEIVHSIIDEDPEYLPALEFVVYNYFEHPESPFSDDEIILFARTILQFHNDKVAMRVMKYYNVST